MTARILLIRHAAHDQLGQVLSGRTPDVALSATGRAQAARLAGRLAGVPLAALHTSPVQRARETADLLARARPGLVAKPEDALDEIDFGTWTGRAFAALAGDAAWDHWNIARATATIPGGETMGDAQARIWSHVVRSARTHPGDILAMVSHADLIRAVLARVLALSLDRLLAFEIAPASVSRIELGEWGARVLSINEHADD